MEGSLSDFFLLLDIDRWMNLLSRALSLESIQAASAAIVLFSMNHPYTIVTLASMLVTALFIIQKRASLLPPLTSRASSPPRKNLKPGEVYLISSTEGIFGRQSSPVSLCAETFMRFRQIPYKSVQYAPDRPLDQPGKISGAKRYYLGSWGNNGICPQPCEFAQVLYYNQEYLSSIEQIATFLESATPRESSTDPLDTTNSALQLAVMRMLFSHTYWVVLYTRWKTSSGWNCTKKVYFDDIPFYNRWFISRRYLYRVSRTLKHLGMSANRHEQVIESGKKDLLALSRLLGDNTYFHGTKDPHLTDACVFSFLYSILHPDFHSELKSFAQSLPNLVAFYEKILSTFYTDNNDK